MKPLSSFAKLSNKFILRRQSSSKNSFPNFQIVLVISLERSNASCWAERTSEWRRRTPPSSVSSTRAGLLIWTRAEVRVMDWTKRWFLFRGHHHHHHPHYQICHRSSEEQPAQVPDKWSWPWVTWVPWKPVSYHHHHHHIFHLGSLPRLWTLNQTLF